MFKYIEGEKTFSLRHKFMLYTHCHTEQAHCPHCHRVLASHRRVVPSLDYSGSSHCCYTPEYYTHKRNVLSWSLTPFSPFVYMSLCTWRYISQSIKALRACIYLYEHLSQHYKIFILEKKLHIEYFKYSRLQLISNIFTDSREENTHKRKR